MTVQKGINPSLSTALTAPSGRSGHVHGSWSEHYCDPSALTLERTPPVYRVNYEGAVRERCHADAGTITLAHRQTARLTAYPGTTYLHPFM